jgi:serine/threonine protein phosphatase PrpC
MSIKLKNINNFFYEDLLKKAIGKISNGWDKLSLPKIGDKRNKYTSGTTALVTLVVGHTVHLLWIGDSRTVWKVDNNKSVFSTLDHKPNKDDLINGAFIKNNRINGVLAVGRAIGDNGRKTRGCLKRTPSYINFEYKKKTEIVMGSDGVYDKISSNHHVFETSFTNKIMKQKRKEEMFFTDNTTFIKIQLNK